MIDNPTTEKLQLNVFMSLRRSREGKVMVEGVNNMMRELLSTKAKVEPVLRSEEGQDIAEYAVMLAVVLVIVVGTIQLIGSHANIIFEQVGSALK